jgi:uncharacterized protein YndB with AHSA1/START domain
VAAQMMNVFRHSVEVRCPVDHAFAVFTERVDAWWPPSHRRIADSRLSFDPGPDGRLVERGPDGAELELGRVRAWEPPARIAFSWFLGAPPGAATSVEITFQDVGSATRVEVVHLEGATPLPDWTRTVAIFERAWRQVLASFQPAAEFP